MVWLQRRRSRADSVTLEERVAENRRRGFLDATSNLAYGLGYGAVAELLIAGMSVWEYLGSRTGNALVGAAVGKWYGDYKDWLYGKFKVDTFPEYSSRWWVHRCTADVYATWTMQLPLYLTVLWATGTERQEMIEASRAVIASSWLIGPTLNAWMDIVRRIGGVPESREAFLKSPASVE